MKRDLMFLFCILLTSFPAFAGDPSAAEVAGEDLVRRGVKTFRQGSRLWRKADFEQAAELFGQECEREPDSFRAHYWEGVALLHVVLHGLGRNGKDGADDTVKRHMSQAVATLEKALDLDPQDSGSHAVLATLLGMRIAGNPVSALWRGSRVERHRKEALRLDPANPRAHYLAGTGYYHAPEMVGGGKRKALSHFRKAERLYKKERRQNTDPLEPRWGYCHCLTFIARTYLELGKHGKAKTYFRKALDVNPEDHLADDGLKRLQEKRRAPD